MNHEKNEVYNGMLCHSLATLEGEYEFIDFYKALLSREGYPLSLVVGSFVDPRLICPDHKLVEKFSMGLFIKKDSRREVKFTSSA